MWRDDQTRVPRWALVAYCIMSALAARSQPTALGQPVADTAPRFLLAGLPIPDIPADQTTPQQPCRQLVPLLSVLNYLGEGASYPFLMGVSGQAFRFVFEPGRWFPSLFYCCEDEWENVCQALGYESELVWNLDATAAVARIEEELARGHLVLTSGLPGTQSPHEAWCAVAAADEDRGILLLRTCYELPQQHPWGYKPENYDPETGHHTVPIPEGDWYANMAGPYSLPRCGLFVVGAKAWQVDRREAVLQSLERAVRFAREGEVRPDSPTFQGTLAALPPWWRQQWFGAPEPQEVVLHSGLAAYEHWIEYLEETPDPAGLTGLTMQVDEQVCQRLWESRGMAAAYLREAAPLLEPEGAGCLERAAQRYEQVSGRFGRVGPVDTPLLRALYMEDEASHRFQQQHPWGWGEWPFPCTGLLSAASRRQVAGELRLCLQDEQAAVTQLEQAVKLEGRGQP